VNIVNLQEINPGILAAAKKAGLESKPDGVFCEWNGKRYFVSRWRNGKFYIQVSRKRNRNPSNNG
jgi:hypothetical protein